MLTYTTAAVTLSEADDYITSRGYSGWPADSGEQTAAIRRGQDYIASKYNHLWLSSFTDATAPTEVKYAIVEAALRDAISVGTLSPDYNPALVVIAEKVKAGPTESSTEFSDTGKMPTLEIPIITNLLRQLIYQPGPSIYVV